MKTVKQLSILTSLAAVSLLSGCDIAEDTCTTNADCAEGETCQIAEGSADENICVAGEGSAAVTCTTDASLCSATQQCDNGACVTIVYQHDSCPVPEKSILIRKSAVDVRGRGSTCPYPQAFFPTK
jgi:hypothetical protein